ncbi:MAG: DUF429 domain-containing protein [Deltaproteobacteria bacterium]|nr:DUF429 domain-containing protein [Deltaproteobacteria bacterium]
MRCLGIDFSGDAGMWTARRSRSNVWIADVHAQDGLVTLKDLRPVQALPGQGAPFDRLVALILSRSFDVAAIDAPFSIPACKMPPGGHEALLRIVEAMSSPDGRPFPRATDFVQAVAGQPSIPSQPRRETELYWRSSGLNVRSTLWSGPRGGAAMTAACLTLLARSGCPIWPWSTSLPGLLAEAFPMAQLFHWGLPYVAYNGMGSKAVEARACITAALDQRIHVGSFRTLVEESADALDAVLCAIAAVAVGEGKLAVPPVPGENVEGWIAMGRR